MSSIRIAENWYELKRLADGVTFMTEPYVDPMLRCNIWHVRGRDRDLVIDTGMGICSLRAFARDILDKSTSAVATHTHLDHIGCHHEFEECLVHPLEARGLTEVPGELTLIPEGFDPHDMATLKLPALEGYAADGPMLTALPYEGYDVRQYRVRPAKTVRLIDEGDVVDLGDRCFRVLHLPGHSPGGIGLFEESTGLLFSGDTIYDGTLLDNLHHSNIADYIETTLRLMTLPVSTVHAGHEPSFGRDRLHEIAQAQLERWDALR